MVIEWAPFRIAAGVDDATLLESSDSLQREFLARQPGFVWRELLRGSDGQWVDLVYWADAAAAHAAMNAAHASPVCYQYFRLMEGGESMDAGAGVLHLQRARTYEGDAERGAAVTPPPR